MIAFIVRQAWTQDVLLNDGTWGNGDTYAERAAVFTCRVLAERRARQYRWLDPVVQPWEMSE